MRHPTILVTIVILLAAAITAGILIRNKNAPANPLADAIIVTAPTADAVVNSPITVIGRARGSWYFEASFPVRIYDANGKLLGSGPVQAKGDWMTNDFVPFSGQLDFSRPSTATGTVVFAKDNPSGLPQNDAQISVPVTFATQGVTNNPGRAIKLYYYNAALDRDAAGNIGCTAAGLVPVDRTIPITQTPIQDTIRLLLKGELTSAEKAAGVTTEFPLPGFGLSAASLVNGVLTLTFDDPQSKSSGGSCRAAILWHQIETTAKQFSGVTYVRFKPDYLFQP